MCRICGNENLELILDYGDMPLVNSLNNGEDSKTYPLKLVRCPECGLVQITETVSPEELFSEYLYFSSQSDTMLAHSKKLVNELIESQKLDEHSFVIELASNDGYLLRYYVEKGIPVLGIEPAVNVAKVANERGIPTLAQFFGLGEAQRLQAESIKADVVHAHNVLAHVADLHGFVEGIKLILKPDGVAVIEVPYLKDLVENCEFDTVYHEHLCYFSLPPLMRLFAEHGLMVSDVQMQKIHGGTLRLYVTHDLDYKDFTKRIETVKEQLKTALAELKSQGKKIAAYGAAAKGCVLLNTCEIDSRTIDYIVDNTPAKWGKYMPGTGIRVYPPGKLLENKPDYVLILAWNFAEEIMVKSKDYKGKFIIPIPKLRICG